MKVESQCISARKFSLNWKGACFVKQPNQGPLRALVDLTESVVVLWMFLLGIIALGIGWLLDHWQVQRITGFLVLHIGLLYPMVGYFVQIIFKRRSLWTLGVYSLLAILTAYLAATVIILPFWILLATIFIMGTLSTWALLLSECIEQKLYSIKGIGIFSGLLVLFVLYIMPMNEINLAPLAEINVEPLLKKFMQLGILFFFFVLLAWQFVRTRIDTLYRVRQSALAIVQYSLNFGDGSSKLNNETNINGETTGNGKDGIDSNGEMDNGVNNNLITNSEITDNTEITDSIELTDTIENTDTTDTTDTTNSIPAGCEINYLDLESLVQYSIAKYGAQLANIPNDFTETDSSFRCIWEGKSPYEERVALVDPSISKKVDALLKDEVIASKLYKLASLPKIRLAIPFYVMFTGLFFSVLSLVVAFVFG